MPQEYDGDDCKCEFLTNKNVIIFYVWGIIDSAMKAYKVFHQYQETVGIKTYLVTNVVRNCIHESAEQTDLLEQY